MSTNKISNEINKLIDTNITNKSKINQILGVSIFKGISDSLKKQNNIKNGKGLTDIDINILKNLNKYVKHGTGLRLAGQGNLDSVKSLLQKNKKIKIHISDILGKDWKQKNHKLKLIFAHSILKNNNMINSNNQTGKGFFDDISNGISSGFKAIGKTVKNVNNKVGNELKNFINGKTSFSPSKLLSYTSAAIGGLGAISALIPGIDIISVPAASAISLGLKSGSLALKTSGRGLFPAGAGLDLSDLSSGRGIDIFPKDIQKFIIKYPLLTKKISNLIKRGQGREQENQQGSGKITKLLSSLGLIGNYSSRMSLALYHYLLEHPTLAARISLKGTANITGKGCEKIKKYKRKKGLIIGTKQDVWNDKSPCEITTGGLKKCDLMIGKGKKIISKKKHMRGKLLYEQNKHKLTPFKKKI